jgi:hypothetical protein
MKVRAKAKGVYGSRRRKVGEVFDVNDHSFNISWMEEVEEPKAEKPAVEKVAPVKRKPGRPRKQPQQDTAGAKDQAKA